MEQLIAPTLDFIQSVGFIGLLIILAVPKLRKLIFNGGNGAEKRIKHLEENHLHEIAEKLDKLIEQNTEILIIIRDLKDKK